jgi:hypothetical protein
LITEEVFKPQTLNYTGLGAFRGEEEILDLSYPSTCKDNTNKIDLKNFKLKSDECRLLLSKTKIVNKENFSTPSAGRASALSGLSSMKESRIKPEPNFSLAKRVPLKESLFRDNAKVFNKKNN